MYLFDIMDDYLAKLVICAEMIRHHNDGSFPNEEAERLARESGAWPAYLETTQVTLLSTEEIIRSFTPRDTLCGRPVGKWTRGSTWRIREEAL